MATKKRDPMLGMSLRERTQYKAKQAQKKIAETKAAKARQLKIDKEAEAARKAAPKNERARAQSEGGGMSKPKPKPTPASKPVKPSSAKTQVAKPESGPKKGDSVAKPADSAPAKGKKTLPPGAPNPRDRKYDGTEGFKRYIRDRKAWERSQKEGKRPTRRAGESNASFNRRLQAYLRNNR